jgi:hypothetical protein
VASGIKARISLSLRNGTGIFIPPYTNTCANTQTKLTLSSVQFLKQQPLTRIQDHQKRPSMRDALRKFESSILPLFVAVEPLTPLVVEPNQNRFPALSNDQALYDEDDSEL